MKRLRAGYYTKDMFYTYKDSTGFWSVGEIINNQNMHIEDFKTYKTAKEYVENLIKSGFRRTA
jgi:hypothetical protein